MPYRIRYGVSIDWVGAGMGQLGSPQNFGGSGNAQTLQFDQSVQGGQTLVGTGTGGILATADVTTLTNLMTTDIAAQMNANLARLQGFASGQP